MENIAVTFKHFSDEALTVDLSLPLQVPVGELLPPLIQRLGWAEESNFELSSEWRLVLQETGEIIYSQQTLGEMGVLPGDILLLESAKGHFRPDANFPKVDAKGRVLVSVDGTIFLLKSARVLIGRPDPGMGLFPADVGVDLTNLDKDAISSRRHAQLLLQDRVYVIRDLGSKHGTYVNGQKLGPGERKILEDGDCIQIGEEGVVLKYQG